MRPAAEAFALGLLHGPAELLPISSSAHLALIGRDAHDDVAVAMHAGTALALLAGLPAERRAALRRFDIGVHLIAGGIPTLAALGPNSRQPAVEYSAQARLALGLGVGALALALADRAPQERERGDATLLDGLLLGAAQASALVPGLSRSGMTLAAARARRFTRPAAAALSRELSVPLLLGAVGYMRPRGTAALAAAAGSFAGTLAALPLLRALERPLWPWSAYRAGVALALVGRSARE